MAIFVNIGTDEASTRLVNLNYVVDIDRAPDDAGTTLKMFDGETIFIPVPLDEFVRRIPPLEIVIKPSEAAILAIAASGPI